MARLSDPQFAGRLRNWREVAAFMIGLAKGDPRGSPDVDRPLAWLEPAIEHFTHGDPKRIAQLIDVWAKVPPIEPALRFRYHVEWTSVDGRPLTFTGFAMLTDVWDELHINEWVPSDAATWQWCNDHRAP